MRRVVLALLCALAPLTVLAVPVTTEAVAPMTRGAIASARRAALADALSRSVETVILRHVGPDEALAQDEVIRKRFVSRPTPYIVRHAVSGERTVGENLHLTVSALVDEEKLLADLAAAGIAAKRLALRPRLYLSAAPDDEAREAARVLRNRLAEEGYVLLIAPGEESVGEVSPEELAARAREAGAHFALRVEAHVAEPPPELSPEEEEAASPAGMQPSGGASAGEGGLVVERAFAEGSAHLVNAAHPELSARLDASAEAEAQGDAEAARLLALDAVGGKLHEALLGVLTQSGWTLTGAAERIEIRVSRIDSPAEVPLLTRAFAGIAEIRSLRLSRVEPGAAVWAAEGNEEGMGWPTVLGTLALPSGQVAWAPTVIEPLMPGAVSAPLRVEGEWLAP